MNVVKSGNLMKYSESVFSSKWKNAYVELLRDSTLRWFDNRGDNAPKRTVNLKTVASYLAFGEVIKKLPYKPDIDKSQITQMFAIPHTNDYNTRLSFFRCANQNELQEWVNAILSTVGPPQGVPQQPNQSAPGGPYPGAPPPASNYPGTAPGGYPGAAPGGYPGAAPGGYPGAAPGGYPGAAPGGYPGAAPGGYPGAAPGGYPGGQVSQSNAAQGPPPIGFSMGGNSGYMPGAPPPPAYHQSQNPQTGYNPPPQYPPSSYNPAPQYPQATTSNPYQPGYRPGAPYVAAGAVPAAGYVAGQPPPTQYVVVDGKKRKKKNKGLKKAAVGLAAGAAGAYVTHKMFGGFGHHWGGGWGMHHGGWGSWSSLSSFGSFSGGSFSFSD